MSWHGNIQRSWGFIAKIGWYGELLLLNFRLRIGYKLMKGHRMHGNTLFNQAKEKHTAMSGLAAVEPERKFVQISPQVTFFEGALMSPRQPALNERRDTVYARQNLVGFFDLREILLGCNSRYLEFLSSLDGYSDGHRALQQLTRPKIDHGTRVRGFNFFDPTEQNLLLATQRPEFNIHGLRCADLKKHLPSVSSGKLSRYLKRLRILGLIKRVAKTYRYYLTRIGRSAVATCEKLTEFTIVQTLATAR